MSNLIPEILQRIQAIHDKKKHDYSLTVDRYSNFTQSAVINSWFKDPVHKVFATLIGIKLSRLAVLLSEDKEPNNESIDDSFLDLDTYCILFHTYYLEQLNKFKYGCKYCGCDIPASMVVIHKESLGDSSLGNIGHKFYFCSELHKNDWLNKEF